MQGWAKGLKDRVERTANHLSTQAASTFTPPPEGADVNQFAVAGATHGQMGESGEGGEDGIGKGTDGDGRAVISDSPSLTLDEEELREASNEELMSLLRLFSLRLKEVEEEHGELKRKETSGGGGGQQKLERALEERQLAKDSARELSERYADLQNKFRILEGSAENGQHRAEYNKLLEKMKGLIGRYKEAQGNIKLLQGQVEELRAQKAVAAPEVDSNDSGGNDDGDGRDKGETIPDFGATIAALQAQLREVTRAKDDAEQRAATAAGAGAGLSTAPNERRDDGEGETVADLKAQLEMKQTENTTLVSRLKELAHRYRALEQGGEKDRKINAAEASSMAPGSAPVADGNMTAVCTTTDTAADEQVVDMKRQLGASNERAEELARRCEAAEAECERISDSLKVALSRLADLDSSTALATTSAAAIEEELQAARKQLQAARDERDNMSAQLEAKDVKFENMLGKTKDLADRYRKLQAQVEASASDLASARQREEKHLAEASAMQEELARTAEASTTAATASEATTEKAQARISELAEQLAAATRGSNEEVGALEIQMQQTAEKERQLWGELEWSRASLAELSGSLEESRARELEARNRAEVLGSELELRDARVAEAKAEAGERVAAVAARLSKTEACLQEAKEAAETAQARGEEARAAVGKLEAVVESAEREESDRVLILRGQIDEAARARFIAEEEIVKAEAVAEARREAQAEMDALREKNAGLASSIEEEASRALQVEREQKLERAKLAGELGGANAEIASLRRQLSEAVKARTKAATDAGAELEKLKKELASLRASSDEKRKRRDEVEEAEGRAAKAKAEVDGIKDQLREHEMEARRKASELKSEKEALTKDLAELRISSDRLDARAVELDAVAKAAVTRESDLLGQLEAAEGRARDVDATAEEALAAKNIIQKELQELQVAFQLTAKTQQLRQEDALAEVTRAAGDARAKLESELDRTRGEAAVLRERANVAEKAQENYLEMRLKLQQARAAEEEARAAEHMLSERLEVANRGVSEQVSMLETQCSQAQRGRRSAEEESHSLAQQLVGLTEERAALEVKLSEAEAEIESVRAGFDEKMREQLLEQMRAAEQELSLAVKVAADEARATEAARLSVHLEERSVEHQRALTRASVTAEQEVSRAHSELEEVSVNFAAKLASAEEGLVAASARAEEFAMELGAARAREADAAQLTSKLEATAKGIKAASKREIEDLRGELALARVGAEEAAREIQRLAAQLDSARDGVSSLTETLREKEAAAEVARQAAVSNATSLEKELSRLSGKLDEATAALTAERERAQQLTTKLADSKEAAAAAESARVVAADAVERGAAERGEAVGRAEKMAETVRVLEGRVAAARRTAEEAELRLEAVSTEGEALREKVEAAEAGVAKIRSQFSEKLQAALTACKKIQAGKEAAEGVAGSAGESVARLESELSRLRAATEKTSAEHLVEVADLSRRLEDRIEEMAAAARETERLRGVEQALRQRVEALEANLEAKSAEAAAADATTAAEDEVKGLEEKIGELEGEWTAALERARVVEKEMKSLREEEQRVRHQIGGLEAEKEAAVVVARAGEEKAQSLREALQAVESEKAQLTDVCKKLTVSLEGAEIELKRSVGERQALEDAVAARVKDVATAQARVVELEAELAELEASEQRARERYDNVSSKLKELILRYKELRDSASVSESNAESFQAAAAEAERQASTARGERDDAREEVEAMRTVVEAADGRVLSLSEEVEKLRQARNSLDRRRAELQMALGVEKLKRAFGVTGGSGAAAAAAANVPEGVFKRWRLAFLEGRQGRIKRESEENRGRAKSFEGLVQRLSEELERQGEVVNRHAEVIRHRGFELEAALDRASRAHDELIAMEPPSLAQAIGSMEILLRVSTESASSMVAAAGGETMEEGPEIIEEKGEVVEEGDETTEGSCGVQGKELQKDVWCLVRYEKLSSKKRGVGSKGKEASPRPLEENEEAGRKADESTLEDSEHTEEEEVDIGGTEQTLIASMENVGERDQPAVVEVMSTVAKREGQGEQGEREGEAEAARVPLPMSPPSSAENESGSDAAAAAVTLTAGSWDSEGRLSTLLPPATAASVAGENTVVVIEWRTQEEVDEWFAIRLAAAMEQEDKLEEEQRRSGEKRDAEGEPVTTAVEAASLVAPRLLPVLDTPATIQESFATEMARLEAKLNSKLEEARAELNRNTEAYKQYRARAHTAIKNSGASQREAEARITQMRKELATERELVRKALEERAAVEARWAEESADLKQRITELEALVESAAARCKELEAGIASSVEEGVKAARDETAAANGRLEEQKTATDEARGALARANTELDKARRELKQRGQLARNLLAEKDAEISRLRSGGRGRNGGGLIAGETASNVNNGNAFGFQQKAVEGKTPFVSVDGVSSSSSPLIIPPMGDSTRDNTGQGHTSPDPLADPFAVGYSSPNSVQGGTVKDRTPPVSFPDSFGADRKRFQSGGDVGGPQQQQQQQTAADSHHAEQQILQMARIQAQRDEEMGRLRVKLQRQSEEIRAREERLATRDQEKERLKEQVGELEAEATRSKELLDQEHGPEKMTYLKNVVKKFVVSEGNERHRLVPVLATILSFSPAELNEVDRAVASATSGGGSSWGSVFGSM